MSTLKVNTIQNTSGGSSSTPEQIEQGRAKSWLNFNMASVSIRDSFNISSITDSGTGFYGINLSNAHSNANYCIVASGSHDAGVYLAHPYVRDRGDVTITASFFQINGYNSADSNTDIKDTFVATFGD